MTGALGELTPLIADSFLGAPLRVDREHRRVCKDEGEEVVVEFAHGVNRSKTLVHSYKASSPSTGPARAP